jgi:hypothetical protein
VLVSALFYVLFAAFSFKDLIVLNIWLYSLSLLFELAAFVWLRVAEPGLARPWRVPGGTVRAFALVVPPAAFALVAMATAGWTNTAAGVGAALTGPLVFAVGRRSARSGSPR